ncbi:hypothetical protein [Flavobacterium saccharophilum]|uniref:Uncharacterized protein n=1 Tax=Flavobacterium saccharophilum TaxID=29534 RepID=A0A1M7E526_9FLAO|nr:hypothetical protein [Flavobacterium saccharophilum]SHL86708.1 hypothetical protein SAMN05444366_1845 [Flavobacterium saccharophilum]
MNEIHLIKKIQLGKNSFPAENFYSKLNFSFYCGNGGIKHEVILSFETSVFLKDLIENGQITIETLAKHQVSKLENLKNDANLFFYRYQLLHPKECNNTYLIIFHIDEYREYWSFFIYGIFEIEPLTNIKTLHKNSL